MRKRTWTEDDIDAVTIERRRQHLAERGTFTHIDGDTLMTDCTPNGVVISPYGVLAFTLFNGEEAVCRVDDSLTNGKTSFLAPGDRVVVESTEDEPVITAVAKRTSKLSRPAIEKGREQVFAANIDLLVIVVAAKKPKIKVGLVDRYLIAADMGGVSPVLCVNKMDLVNEVPEVAAGYASVGVPVFPTSCETGEGIDALREYIAGKQSVFAGHSGVGKSSLVNAMIPDADIETQTVSDQTEKGRHTTTSSRMFIMDDDTRIIDTPGIKQLGLWQMEADEVGLYFPEIAEAAEGCRFRNCTHEKEPDCAVIAAVASGAIQERRYRSYLRIRESL